MVTIRELFDVTYSITMVEILARDETGHLLHRFLLGKNCDREHIPKGLVTEWTKGQLTICDRKINCHNDERKSKQPEIGWGLKDGAIPDELLDAEITHLHMRCKDGIEYEVSADVLLSAMTVEMLKYDFEEKEATEGR